MWYSNYSPLAGQKIHMQYQFTYWHNPSSVRSWGKHLRGKKNHEWREKERKTSKRSKIDSIMLKQLNSTLSQSVSKSLEFSEEKGVGEVEYYWGVAWSPEENRIIVCQIDLKGKRFFVFLYVIIIFKQFYLPSTFHLNRKMWFGWIWVVA